MRALTSALIAFSVMFVTSARSDSYPTEAVTIINPFPAGSPVDLVARVAAEELQKSFGRPFVVLSKPGAGGVIGAQSVATAKPDGHTLLLTSTSTQVIAPEVRKQVPYDPKRAFKPIGQITRAAQVVVVHPSLPAKSLQELIDYAKANPEKVTYGSSGFGTILHLAAELFQARTHAKLFHVPYNGAAPALTALVGGHVQVLFDSVSNAAPQVEAGKVRALAVLSSERSDMLPDVPTAEELGIKGLEFPGWMGLFAPSGVPDDIIEKLDAALKANLSNPEVIARFKKAGLISDYVGAQKFQSMLDKQTDLIREIVSAAKIERQ